MSGEETKGSRILLIDDKEELIRSLGDALDAKLDGLGVNVERWVPTKDDKDPNERFEELASPGISLVVTDYDLSLSMTGLKGPIIQSWCQRNRIPVAVYSRGHVKDLPGEPSLFEILIRYSDDETAAAVIAGMNSGFTDVYTTIARMDTAKLSLAMIAALVIERPEYEPTLSLYFSRLISSNPSIRGHLLRVARQEEKPDTVATLSYVVGHVLLNLVLAYPGPILSRPVLAAYLCVATDEVDEFVKKAGIPPYEGPFNKVRQFVWREDVDSALTEATEKAGKEAPEEIERFNRFAAELILGKEPSRHSCEREGCNGERGGYWCPFTERTVCSHEDCSESSTAWIPDGADLCRVEADFFQEFSPFLDS